MVKRALKINKILFWTAALVLPGGSLLAVYELNKKYKLSAKLIDLVNTLRRRDHGNDL